MIFNRFLTLPERFRGVTPSAAPWLSPDNLERALLLEHVWLSANYTLAAGFETRLLPENHVFSWFLCCLDFQFNTLIDRMNASVETSVSEQSGQ